MYQLFPRPDPWLARCGHLEAAVVRRHIAGVPAFMRGLRAMFLTDAHVLSRTTGADLDRLVNRIAAQQPDLVLLGGDYSDTREGAARFFGALSALKPPLGTFGVIGNNDAQAWTGRLDAFTKMASEAGCEMLINGSVRIDRNGGAIWIAGVDEHRFGVPRAAGLFPAAPAPDAYRLLISHYPARPDATPDIMLCGHTHGGQFNFLGLTPFAVGFERFKQPHRAAMAVSGLFDVGDMKLLVSKGIGASRLQLRAGVRPEMELLVFE